MSTTRTVTVMFTDLVGSTATSHQLDAASADQLRDNHFSLLRSAVTGHGGREVKNLGDGLMVVFDSAVAALSAAEEIQRAVHLHNHTRDNVPLAVRVGLSLGEVVEEDGDFFGDAVVEAARLCALAEGAQVLATHLLALTTGRRATQELRPLGSVELKGLAEPVEIVEVAWTPPAQPTSGDDHVPLPARCVIAPEVALVGRHREFDELAMVMKQARAGNRQLVLIGGEPGIGKTTVACAVARQAYDEGSIVVFGRADEDLGLPYQPWVEALQHLLDHLPREMATVVDEHRSSLARILPIETTGDMAGRDEVDAESARYVLYEAVREVVAAAAEIAPVLVLLDDIQWADAPSLALLRHLISMGDPQRLMVIATFRESDVTADHPLAALLAWLYRQTGITRLSLRGLDDAELLALMEAAAGQEMTDDGLSLRDALLAETDGNPFFVTELIRHLVETNAIYQEGDRWVASADLRSSGLPVSVQEVVGRRVKRLGGSATDYLAAAAVIGPEFDLPTVAAVTSTAEDIVLDVVEAACEARLIIELGPERYRFAHALVEHSLYDALTPTRRARLHRRIAELIEADESQRRERVGELAHHWAEATAPQESAKAVQYAVLAGERALDRLAPDEALRWYSQALELLGPGSACDERLRPTALIGLGDAQRQLGSPSFRATLLEAAHLARRIGAPDLLVSAALLNTRGFISSVATPIDHEKVGLIEAALQAVDQTDLGSRARLLALLSSELLYVASGEEQRARVAAAVEMARESGDPRTLAAVITMGYLAIDVPETLAYRFSLIDEALAAAEACGDVALQFWTTNFRSYTMFQAGEVAAAHSLQETFDDLVRQPIMRWVRGYAEAAYFVMLGDFPAAEAQAAAAHEVGVSTGQPDIALYYLAQFGQLQMLRGDCEDMIEVLRQSARDSGHIQLLIACLARSLCILRRNDEAVEAMRGIIDGSKLDLHEDQLWPGTAILVGEVVCELGLVDSAVVLYERLLPYPDHLDYIGVQSWGLVGEILARLAAVQGLDAAGEHFTRAIAGYERIGARYFLARAQIYYGQWLVGRGLAGDRATGQYLIETGLAAAQTHGYSLLERIATN